MVSNLPPAEHTREAINSTLTELMTKELSTPHTLQQYEPETLGTAESAPGLVVPDVRRENVVEPLYEWKTKQLLIDFPALEPLDCHCNNGDGRDCFYAYQCKQERHVWRE